MNNLIITKPAILDSNYPPKLIAHLWQEAKNAQKNAYAPYSKFLVGAAIVDENGNIHNGANVENAAYPQGACAEANAIGKMATSGNYKIRAILVVGNVAFQASYENETAKQNNQNITHKQIVTPCGGCRQKIREFASPDTPIILASDDEIFGFFTLEQLLPHSFGPEHLG